MAPKPKCGGCGTCERCERAAYMREWYRSGNAEAQRQSQQASRRRRSAKVREYDRDRKRTRNKDAVRAHNLVYKAVSRGKVKRQPCEVCGSFAEAHHDDYSKPLDVRWLCRAHHMQLHRKVA